jgi:hypothetical protein
VHVFDEDDEGPGVAGLHARTRRGSEADGEGDDRSGVVTWMQEAMDLTTPDQEKADGSRSMATDGQNKDFQDDVGYGEAKDELGQATTATRARTWQR